MSRLLDRPTDRPAAGSSSAASRDWLGAIRQRQRQRQQERKQSSRLVAGRPSDEHASEHFGPQRLPGLCLMLSKPAGQTRSRLARMCEQDTHILARSCLELSRGSSDAK